MISETKRFQPVRDLVEFTFIAVPVENKENTFDLNVELRAGAAEIDMSSLSDAFTVKLKRIFIEMECSGSTIEAGSKYGEPLKSNSITSKHNFKREQEVKIGASADGSVDLKIAAAAAASGKGSVAASRHASSTEEVASETTAMRVKARGNERWEIAEIDGQPLDGKILNNERLFVFKKNDRSNAVLVAGRIIVKPKDFKFDYNEGYFGRLSVNDRKLLGVFLIKKLQSGHIAGEITLAELQLSLD